MSKQSELEGFERPVNKKVENVLQVLDAKRKAKTRAGNAHKEAESRAIAIMREEKLTEYTSADLGLTMRIDEVEHAKLETYSPPAEPKVERKLKVADA